MVRIKLSADLPDSRYGFSCPGCGGYHEVPTEGSIAWGFNGSLEKPTFTPSILVRWTRPLTDEQCKRVLEGEKIEPIHLVCHSFVTDGKIQFLSDCTHKLAGQTVELLEVTDDSQPKEEDGGK